MAQRPVIVLVMEPMRWRSSGDWGSLALDVRVAEAFSEHKVFAGDDAEREAGQGVLLHQVADGLADALGVRYDEGGHGGAIVAQRIAWIS
jgi:hypothetical protein